MASWRECFDFAALFLCHPLKTHKKKRFLYFQPDGDCLWSCIPLIRFSFLCSSFICAFVFHFDTWVVLFVYFGYAAPKMEPLGDEKQARIESLRKKAINASNKFRNSMTRKGRRSSKVMSIEIEDVHIAEELEVVDAFRQILVSEDLLPASHDDYHTMLRFIFLFLFFFPLCRSVSVVYS